MVLEAIRKEQIDLLVLGTRGRTGLTKLVLGSVAEELFRRAPCPVLTVGPSAAPDPAPDYAESCTRLILAHRRCMPCPMRSILPTGLVAS